MRISRRANLDHGDLETLLSSRPHSSNSCRCKAEAFLGGYSYPPKNPAGNQLNLDTQIATVGELKAFASELPEMPSTSFGGTDQAFWYGMIRRFRPKRIIEVGSGDSTRTAMQAIAKNGDTAALCSCWAKLTRF